MNCQRCGSSIPTGAEKCASCVTARSGLWWNAYAALLLITVVAVDIVFMWKKVPLLATAFAEKGYKLPLSLRLLIGVTHFGGKLLPFLLLALILWVVVWRAKKFAIPSFARSGALLAVIAWIAVTGILIALMLAASHLTPGN